MFKAVLDNDKSINRLYSENKKKIAKKSILKITLKF